VSCASEGDDFPRVLVPARVGWQYDGASRALCAITEGDGGIEPWQIGGVM